MDGKGSEGYGLSPAIWSSLLGPYGQRGDLVLVSVSLNSNG